MGRLRFGREQPFEPYETWDLLPLTEAPNQAGASKIKNMMGDDVWIDKDGKPILKRLTSFNFMGLLDAEQSAKVLQILGVPQLGPDMCGPQFTLANPNFTMSKIQLTSKSSTKPPEIKLLATFSTFLKEKNE